MHLAPAVFAGQGGMKAADHWPPTPGLAPQLLPYSGSVLFDKFFNLSSCFFGEKLKVVVALQVYGEK